LPEAAYQISGQRLLYCRGRGARSMYSHSE
jgi:hypothetical protein